MTFQLSRIHLYGTIQITIVTANNQPTGKTENEAKNNANCKPKDDRFQRWQKITIDQFGYTPNLILTLTIAALGYWFFLLKNHDFSPGSSAKCAMIFSLVALAVSAVCGLYCSLNRLWDFRGTAQRAGEKPNAPSKDELKWLGSLTWGLFYTQLASFTAGILALAIALHLTYGGKLA